MNKEKIKGAVDQTVGGARRAVGNSTGDTKGEFKGAVQELKGKAETAVGNMKDAAKDAHNQAVASQQARESRREMKH